MDKRLSIADKLLLAALDIEKGGKGVFSAEDLVVSAWRRFPDAFGLQGYLDEHGKPLFPNSNRVYAEIMGSKPLRKQGMLQKVGNKMYKLTEAGRARGLRVGKTDLTSSAEKWALGREHIEQIRRLFESKAAQKLREGDVEDVSFFDACGFWGISPRSRAKEMWSRFADIETLLKMGLDTLGGRGGASAVHGANAYTADDLRSLREFHELLQRKFGDELEVIKKRHDERKF
jgi:hypothetical protein